MSMYASPLRYPGGKGSLYKFMFDIFYNNDLCGIAYAEPYAGGAGLALRLLFDGYVNRVYINDLDISIYSFWTIAVNRSEELCRWINDVEITIDTWLKCKEIMNNASGVDSFELAKATFFLNRTNISGILKGGVIGGYHQNGKYKMDARFHKQELIQRFQRIASVKDRISVSNLDALDFIDRMNRSKDDVFIYLDPPYYQKGSDLYMNFYDKQDHEKLADYIRHIQKRWMISYDNHTFILNLYQNERKLIHRISQATSNRSGNELLIFSDTILFEEAMAVLREPRAVFSSF